MKIIAEYEQNSFQKLLELFKRSKVFNVRYLESLNAKEILINHQLYSYDESKNKMTARYAEQHATARIGNK